MIAYRALAQRFVWPGNLWWRWARLGEGAGGLENSNPLGHILRQKSKTVRLCPRAFD